MYLFLGKLHPEKDILELLMTGDISDLEELQSDQSDCEVDVPGPQPVRLGMCSYLSS